MNIHFFNHKQLYMDRSNTYEIFVTSLDNVATLTCSPDRQSIVIITENSNEKSHIVKEPQAVAEIINNRAFKKETKSVLFISGEDELNSNALKTTVQHIYNEVPHCRFALFVPYKDPPKLTQREDGCVRSFLVSANFFNKRVFSTCISDFTKLAYELLYPYLSSNGSSHVEVFQIGKKQAFQQPPGDEVQQLLDKSLLIIPHKGALSLLKRCLISLNQTPGLPSAINLCFDDKTFKKLDTSVYDKMENRLNIYTNEPGNVGPYLARHFSIIDTNMDYVFFQDSDDISLPARFVKQIRELEKRDLDMIGSHELRIDEFEHVVTIMRYPLNVTESLDSSCFHALFHPTSLITKKAYLKTGGFSTDLRFGYDSQFLLRSYFYLKLGNIDDFLYIRFKRPNSLTTAPKTKLGTNLRTFLLWRWQIDFKLVKADHLALDDSSLSVQKHRFDYKMIEVK